MFRVPFKNELIINMALTKTKSINAICGIMINSIATQLCSTKHITSSVCVLDLCGHQQRTKPEDTRVAVRQADQVSRVT